jgi:Pyruvate/2-oxoacid:ferredoxin oxidoreductase delta subunit
MCEFCHKHGEGKKWYLQARNYSEDLVLDRSRGEYVEEFLPDFELRHRNILPKMKLYSRAPKAIQAIIGTYITRKQKKSHFGQVVPIEDIEQILQMANRIVRVDCVCRRITTGDRNARFCFGISVEPDGGSVVKAVESISGPDALGLEELDRDEALNLMRGFEHEALIHSIWTFGTPFIGGICNCDGEGCLAMRAQVSHGVKVMFKAEHVASVDPGLCIGCKACLRLCQFEAMHFMAADKKVWVDASKCYGCGVCRAECPTAAISIPLRNDIPSVAYNW